MRSEWAPKGEIMYILRAMHPKNALACEVSLFTGLRINDVLALKSELLKSNRFTVREQKTGKTKRIYLPQNLHSRMLACSGQHFVFEGRLNGKTHRTRQAVFKDIKRVINAFGLKKQISPHSMRKVYAVNEFKNSGGNIKRVQKLLNHNSEAVTYLYALADLVTKKKNFTKI